MCETPIIRWLSTCPMISIKKTLALLVLPVFFWRNKSSNSHASDQNPRLFHPKITGVVQTCSSRKPPGAHDLLILHRYLDVRAPRIGSVAYNP